MSARGEKIAVALVLTATIPALFVGAARIGIAQATTPPAWFVTTLDRALPLVPAAVWIYVSWYPMSAALLRLERAPFRKACLAYVVAFGTCLGGYWLFPLTIERPTITTHGGMSAWMLARLYGVDPPVNLFPSFHAAVAVIMSLVVPGGRPVTAAVGVWALALCWSCVLTKQHYIVDVIAGAVVGALGVAVAEALCRVGTSQASASDAGASVRAGSAQWTRERSWPSQSALRG